jgi:hypothetical protein
VVSNCGLSGDLSELKAASVLQRLEISRNRGITSLEGIPTQSLVGISADGCSLSGDLSELSGAANLAAVRVQYNRGLTSLEGIPHAKLEELVAACCGLTGDYTYLSQLPNLKLLDLRRNPEATLDKLKFKDGVKICWYGKYSVRGLFGRLLDFVTGAQR